MAQTESAGIFARYLAAKQLFFESKIAKQSSTEVWASIGHRLPEDRIVFGAWYDDEKLEFGSIDQFERWAESLERP